MKTIDTLADVFPDICLACGSPIREHRAPARKVVVCDRLIPPDWRCVTDNEGRLDHVIVPVELADRAVEIAREGAGRTDLGFFTFNLFGPRKETTP